MQIPCNSVCSLDVIMKNLVLYTIFILTVIVCIQGLDRGAKRELWQGILGDQVYDLTSSPKYKNQPADIVTILTLLEAPDDIGENYGQRVTSYFLAPETGYYYFYLSCNLACQLWVSTDHSSSNVVLNIEIKPPGLANYQDWQKSNTPIFFAEKHFYYIKLLMKEKNGSDFLGAGVRFPSGVELKPIGANYLFRTIPEHRSGSFVQTSRDVIPGDDAVIRSFVNVTCQLTCANYCISQSKCHSFIYHVITRACVLYKLSKHHVIHSDWNSYLYVKVM
ncbi:uncharacterized protein LOC110251852 [Exaiptasia diaphana]|uniref:PA14 domain-containing protein n=1 Tax=Exaiptasia diaphana TaxID=2652724 RepID=A0A913Y3P1_EXADI|nr:uncharacterized protein LOC110251852 [Exaiptasia diaphana]